MVMAKAEIIDLVRDLPEPFEIEELQYRLYLREKLEFAEAQIQEGASLSHEEALHETSQWFEK